MKYVVGLLVLMLSLPSFGGEIVGSITIDSKLKKHNKNRSSRAKRISKKFRNKEKAYKVKWSEGSATEKGEDERDHAVIYLTRDGDGSRLKTTPSKVVIWQKERRFRKHVSVIPKGSKVIFKNGDKFHHYIDCRDDTTLNVGEQKSGAETVRKPDQVGPLELFCNIHHKMNAYVYVVPNDFFATPEKGKFSLKGVPPGNYTVKAWHPRLAEQIRRNVKVPATGATKVEFKL